MSVPSMSVPSMSVTAQRKARAAPAPETALRIRQRQRLIDACISALHLHGPSSTTVEKVVTIADMSPGIVNFYFDTKAAMLVAALEHLAVEFEREVLVPVGALREDPARALALLIDLYLDPDLASPRKVSVWYAFWGEANSRQEYHDICGKKDDGFAVLVQDLIARMIVKTGQSALDADGVALGLIGALEILWQNIAFQDEANVDRAAYKRRCRAYLRSVFPGNFIERLAPERAALPRALTSAYADPGLFAIERDMLLFPAWQPVAHDADLVLAGDYVASQLAGERILVVRGEGDQVHALRNACAIRPHALGEGPAGHFDGDGIFCPMDGYAYGYDGAATAGGRALAPLPLTRGAGLIFARVNDREPAPAPNLGLLPPAFLDGLEPVAPTDETDIAADWKLIAEYWLDSLFTDGSVEQQADGVAWHGPPDGNHLVRVGAQAVDTPGMVRLFLFPNTLIEADPVGVTILQILGVGAGRSRIRRLFYGRNPGQELDRPLADVARRTDDKRLARTLDDCESAQAGLTAPLYQAGAEPVEDSPSRYFRDWLAGRLPKAAAG